MRHLDNLFDSGIDWHFSLFISIDYLNLFFDMVCYIVDLDNPLNLYHLFFDELNNLSLSGCDGNFNNLLLNNWHLDWNLLICRNSNNLLDNLLNDLIDLNNLRNYCLELNNLDFFNEFFNNSLNWHESWNFDGLFNDLFDNSFNNLNLVHSFSHNNFLFHIGRYLDNLFINNNFSFGIDLRNLNFHNLFNVSLDLDDLSLFGVDWD